MSRIPAIDPADATGTAAELLAAVQASLGTTPNMTRVMATAPAVLDGYLALSAALGKGRLNAGTRERIAVAVADANDCDYCLAAHSYLGTNVAKLSNDEVSAARRFRSTDPKTDAILRLARDVVSDLGAVSDDALAAARDAGITDSEILETVAHVALNYFTNAVNRLAQTDVDFPTPVAA
jgi:uncharacterized peroxidase-related enzyme